MSGTVTVSASVPDGTGVTALQFLLDDAALGWEQTTPPYAIPWNTTAVANGGHKLSARVRDAAGHSAVTSVAVAVANDTTAPTVSMTTPAGGATVTGKVAVTAAASDNVKVVGVQFVLDGVSLGAERMAAPYSIVWDTSTAANGSHLLSARARDAAGNTTASAAVKVLKKGK